MISRAAVMFASLLMLSPLAALAADEDFKELQSASPRNEWVPIRNDELRHIKTWAKHEDGKRLRSFKAEGVWDVSLDALARTYTDVPNMPRWYWETLESRMLKKVSNTEYFYYMRFNAPLNLPDRDAVFHAVIEPYSPKRGYWQATVKAAPDYLPAKPGLVRVVAQDLYARVTPIGKNQIKFETEGYVDPGGSVPAWTINFVQQRVPYLIMVSLLRMAQGKEYSDASAPSEFTVTE